MINWSTGSKGKKVCLRLLALLNLLHRLVALLDGLVEELLDLLKVAQIGRAEQNDTASVGYEIRSELFVAERLLERRSLHDRVDASPESLAQADELDLEDLRGLQGRLETGRWNVAHHVHELKDEMR